MSAPPALPGDLPAVERARPMGGGSICEVWSVDLADGTRAVVKRAPYPVEIEADGLAALAAVGGPVPAVLAADGRVLVLERVDGPPDWEGLGAAVAGVHRDVGRAFGWHRDNLIGSLPQANDEAADWPDFYAERRVRPWLGALPAELRGRLERACDGPLRELLATDPPASLIHGDLWSGNVVAGRWLIDPAVCRCDRELELAFADLFGGLPEAFTRAYQEAWPLAEGWQRRRPALQLYHLLVHVELFGGGYVGAVADRLDALGW